MSTLQVKIQRVLDISQLGYEVSIKEFSKPALTNDLGTNASGSDKRKREIHVTINPKTTSSKSVDHTPAARCVFCGNDPKAQLRLKLPHCDLFKRTCANFDHLDCNRSGASSFEDSEIGKKYTASKKKRYIIAGWHYDDAAKTMIKMVNYLDLYTYDQSHITNEHFPSNILVSNGASLVSYFA